MAVQNQIEVGSKAPTFTVQAGTSRLTLEELIKDHNLLIFFVREFGCHTCMEHALALAKIQAELGLTGTRTILIGGGSYEAAQKVGARYKLPYSVFGDPDRSIYQKFNFDKSVLIIQKSGTVLIDKTGTIRYINRQSNPGASVNKVEILAAANALIQGN